MRRAEKASRRVVVPEVAIFSYAGMCVLRPANCDGRGRVVVIVRDGGCRPDDGDGFSKKRKGKRKENGVNEETGKGKCHRKQECSETPVDGWLSGRLGADASGLSLLQWGPGTGRFRGARAWFPVGLTGWVWRGCETEYTSGRRAKDA